MLLEIEQRAILTLNLDISQILFLERCLRKVVEYYSDMICDAENYNADESAKLWESRMEETLNLILVIKEQTGIFG